MASVLVRPETQVDLSARLKINAQILRETAPATTWQTVIRNPEVDELIALSKHRMLIGLTEMSSGMVVAAIFPSYGPYIMLDTQSGREIWRLDRDPDYDHRYTVLASEPLILIQRANDSHTTFTAVDPRTGTVLWTKDATGRVGTTVSGGDGVLIYASQSQGVTAIDILKGTPIWTAPATSSDDDRALSLFLADGRVFVLDRDVRSWSLKDGAQFWSAPQVGAAAPSSFPLPIDDRVIIPSADGRLSLVKTDGKLIWSSALPGQPGGLVWHHNQVLFEAVSADRAKAFLVSVSLADGRVLWQRPLAEPASSPIRVVGTSVALVLSNALEVYDVRTGERRYSSALPFSAPANLSYHTRVESGRIVVAGETAIAAFHASDGRLLWAHVLKGAGEKSYAAFLNSVQGIPAPSHESPSNTVGVAISRMAGDSAIRDGVKRAEQYRASVYAATESQARSLNRLDRLAASSERFVASHGGMVQKQVAASMERVQGSVNMMMLAIQSPTVGMAIGSMIREYRVEQAGKSQLQAQLAFALKAHNLAIQGKYFMRPFVSKRGLGVVVVDMDNGQWVEIPTSPREDSSTSHVFLDSQLCAVSDEGRYLVTKGIGLDPAKWEEDRRYMYAKTMQRSLLAYDLDALTFKSQASYRSEASNEE